MTQEEKDLIYKDLCSRLPYKVNCEFRYKEKDYINLYGFAIPVLKINTDTGETEYKTENRTLDITDLEAFSDGDLEIKPYLRPLSSMTEEERKEYFDIKMQECERYALAEVSRPEAITIVLDWLYERYFDPRDLIGNDLARKAPDGMYNKK